MNSFNLPLTTIHFSGVFSTKHFTVDYNSVSALSVPVCTVYVVINFVDIYILLDVLLCSIAEYFYELCRILASP